MPLSTFSYIVSALEFLAGLSVLVSPARTADWLLKLKEDDVMPRLVGALFFVLCFLVLTSGIAIGVDVKGLVRLVVWVGAVKSLVMCWWPRWLIGRADWVFSRPVLLRPFSLIPFAAGVLFLLAGNSLQGAGL